MTKKTVQIKLKNEAYQELKSEIDNYKRIYVDPTDEYGQSGGRLNYYAGSFEKNHNCEE